MIKSSRFAAVALLAAGSLALSACGGQQDAAGEGGAEASGGDAPAAALDVTPRAGRWETNMTIEKIDMPGLPPEMQEMAKSQFGAVNTSFSCLTPEEAAKPKEDFFAPGENDGCSYDNFEMGGGKIAVDMTCEENGSKQVMKMNGTYGEEAYTMNVTADGEMSPGQPMSMAMSISARRVGECDGNEES